MLRLKQVNFKARLQDLKDLLIKSLTVLRKSVIFRVSMRIQLSYRIVQNKGKINKIDLSLVVVCITCVFIHRSSR